MKDTYEILVLFLLDRMTRSNGNVVPPAQKDLLIGIDISMLMISKFQTCFFPAVETDKHLTSPRLGDNCTASPRTLVACGYLDPHWMISLDGQLEIAEVIFD